MKVKVGDKVRVLAGKDKGTEGTVVKTLKKDNKVVVEGVNIVKKHIKPNRFNEVGSIQEMEAPIHVSNVKLVDSTKKAEKPAKKEVKEAKAETKPAKATKAAKTTTKKSVKKAS